MPVTPSRHQLPYAHLNLRRNPFGEFSEDERAALALVDIGEVVSKLSEHRYAVQFIGEKGYGKTTHLLALRSHFPNAGYVHIPEGKRAAVPDGSPILIDEAQRLTRWQRFRVFRPEKPLVLGTHRDFQRELRRAGRVVETIEVRHSNDLTRLLQLLNARICWVRRADGPIPSVTRETASTLRQKFGPNIRGMLHELYVVFQRLDSVRDV